MAKVIHYINPHPTTPISSGFKKEAARSSCDLACWILEYINSITATYSQRVATKLTTLVNCPKCKESWEYIEADIEHGTDSFCK